ncbi:hypothetical protein BCR35DRAFT_307738 [Leucosporidium creatinivorum]|uniref:6-phosphogluconate dehydrogenase NADP-binding domain-containing protein n=1 Tax=Leucosporidium creatinivorum TaxID=106004 RepID=A0A1Y2ELP2_9BASI|nr:hypothetical protein BCR35DRAFT_307738 [Leucosporidium creatinivorum]
MPHHAGKHAGGQAHEQVGFIGLGNMGSKMSSNLSTWLHENSYPPLLLWNRTASKLPAESDSIAHAASIKELAEKCDVVITSLSNDEVAQEVYGQLFEGVKSKQEKGAKGNTYFVESSTLYPLTAGELERQASHIPRTFYLQSPVFGPPPVAADAKLVWVLSGDHNAKKAVTKLLVPSMGRKVIDVGSNVERASAFKLNGNMLILGIIEILAESMTLADKSGVGSNLLMEFIKEFLPASSFIGYGSKITSNNFAGETGFTVEGGLKDANHIRHLAASVDATIPTIDVAHRHLITSRANGGNDLDWSSLVAGPRLAAGLLPFKGVKDSPRDTGFGSRTDEEADEGTVPVPDGGIKHVQNF